MVDLVPKLFLLGILLALSAFFSGSEAAIFSLANIEKRRLKKQHPFVWKTISMLLDTPRRTLITILIGNMFVNTMAVALVTFIALDWFGGPGAGWTIAIFTFVLVITSELTPKIFAVRHNESVAFVSAIPLDLFSRAIYPIRRVVRWIADHVLSWLIHEKKGEADLVSETELKALARIGEEEGALRAEEGAMIRKLIGLGDRMVREIMTPRTDIVAVDIEEAKIKLANIIKQFHFSYVLVYEQSIDNLIGVLPTQEFMLSDQSRLRELMVPPHYVPETKPIDELLQDFKRMKHRVAICVDEHGGTAGLVTIEDVIEEIFGEFYDEYAQAESLVKHLEGNRFLVDAKISLREFRKALGIRLDSQTSETLSGWLMEQLGRIPKPGDSYTWHGVEFRIREVFRQRISKVEIYRKQ